MLESLKILLIHFTTCENWAPSLGWAKQDLEALEQSFSAKMIPQWDNHFGKRKACYNTLHYDSAPRPQRSCFANPNLDMLKYFKTIYQKVQKKPN